jgi:SAM-dependent methyltransferase
VCRNASNFETIAGARTDHWIAQLGIGLNRSRWAICKVCGLVMQNPRPNAVAYKHLYQGSFYHAHQTSPDQVQESIRLIEYCFEDKIAFAERYYKLRALAPWRVLDIGCGMGESLIAFRARGFQTTGVQPDPAVAALAREHLKLELDVAFFSQDSYPENSFSVVFTNHSFEHFDDPAGVAEGIARVLKPGGICFTCVPTYERNKTMTARGWMNSAHNWVFTHHTLGALFRRYGLRPLGYTCNGTNKYTDEVWLVVEKPVEGLRPEPIEQILTGLPSWQQARRTLTVFVPLRTGAYLPWVVYQKARKFLKKTGGRPRDVAAYLKQVYRTRARQLRLWLQSFLSSPS